METSQHLATESFSYSWLLNAKSMENSDEATSNLVINLKRSYLEESQNFRFDTAPISDQSSIALVHADELFSNGIIKPIIYVDDDPMPRMKSFDTWDYKPILPLPSSSLSARNSNFPIVRMNCSFLGKWKKSYKKMMKKCIGLLIRPLCSQKLGKITSRVDDLERRVLEARSYCSSPNKAILPRRSVSYSVGDLSDMEISPIHEAVLHCKRSFEK